MSDLNIALVLRFIDQATAPARKAMEGLQATGKQVEDFGRTQITAGREQAQIARQQQQQMRGEVMGLVGMVTSIYAGLRGPVLFEQEMSKVGAVTRANNEDLVAMTDEAERLGETTHHSALRAAEGMRFLGMAGFDVASIITAMPGVLDMAMANDASVADAARLSSDFLSQFELGADRMGYVADVITNVTTSANTDLMALGETMKNSGVTANMMGIKFHDLAGMAGILAERGFAGAEAGTGLSRMLLALVSPTDNALEALEGLNVQTTDAEGNLRPIPDLLAEIGAAMQGMGDVERGSLMQTIFGTYALRPARILMMEAMSGALQQYQIDILETGAAARVAGQMADNTAGDFMLWGSAMASVAISIGRAVLPEIRALLQTVTPLVQALSGWIRENPELVTQLARVAAVMISLRLGVFMLRWAFWALVRNYANLRIVFGFLTAALGHLITLSAFLALRAIPVLKLALLALGNVLLFAGRMAVLALWGLRAMGAGLWALATRPLVALRALGSAAMWFGRAALLLVPALAKLAWPITLLVAAAILLRRYWDRLRAVFRGVGRAIMEGLQPAFDWLRDTLGNLRGLIGAGFGWIAEALGIDAEAVSAAFARMFDVSAHIARLKEQITAGFSWVGSFFGNLFAREVLSNDEADAIAARAQALTERILGSFRHTFETLRNLAEAAFTYITGWTFDDVGQALRSAFDIDLYSAGVDLITRLGEGIWSVLTGLVANIKSSLANIAPDWLTRGGGSANPNAGPGGGVPGGGVTGARDMGGVVRPGFLYEINERGQEFFAPDRPGSVIKGSDLRAGGGSGGGDVIIGDVHVHAAPGQDPMAIAREVQRVLREEMRKARYALNDGALA